VVDRPRKQSGGVYEREGSLCRDRYRRCPVPWFGTGSTDGRGPELSVSSDAEETLQRDLGSITRTVCCHSWRSRTIADCTGSLRVHLSLLFRQLKNLDEILAAYGVEVEALAASSRYEEPVKALTCYSNRLGITRQGNRYLRTALIEANQRGHRIAALGKSAALGKDVKARRAKSRSEYVAIADRCAQGLFFDNDYTARCGINTFMRVCELVLNR